MFLLMQNFDFFPESNQICPNKITFTQISPQFFPNFNLNLPKFRLAPPKFAQI